MVLADRMDGRMETHPQFTPDYIYAGRALPEQTEPGVQYILDADVWKGEPDTWPAFNYAQLELMETCAAELKFLFTPYMALTREVVACLKQYPEAVVVSQSNHPNRVGEHRAPGTSTDGGRITESGYLLPTLCRRYSRRLADQSRRGYGSLDL